MTIRQILSIQPALNALVKFPELSAKVRWRLSRNLLTCAEVQEGFDNHKNEIIIRLGKGKSEVLPKDPEFAAINKEINDLLSVESEVKLLSFPFSELVTDTVAVPADVLAALDRLIEGSPNN